MAGTGGVQKLTMRQKEILRLLLNGYDAKSAGQRLGISVHTVNEHLREARRSLGVTSSREAARILGQAESGTPKNMSPMPIGMADQSSSGSKWSRPIDYRGAAYIGVVIVLIMAAATIVIWTVNGGAASPVADEPPNVLSTHPSSGTTIAPGPFTLAVTFDRPMLEGSYSFVQVSPESYPECGSRPQLSSDRRSFTLQCTALPGHSYEVWFNRPPFMNFRSLNGVSAEPYRLLFRTRSR